MARSKVAGFQAPFGGWFWALSDTWPAGGPIIGVHFNRHQTITELMQTSDTNFPLDAKERKVMKGRPITTEEFEWMFAVTHKIVGVAAEASWKHYLERAARQDLC